ncbi:transketolase family protein, partial [Eubacterium aggregans]
QSLEDFAIIRMIPGVVVLAPQDPAEIRAAVKAMIDYEGPVYMRIGNPKIPVLFEEKPFTIGKGQQLNAGADITLISTGSMTGPALEAVKQLEAQGISVDHLGMPTVCPLDTELVRASAAKTHKVYTVEEHYVDGGLGTLITECLSDMADTTVHRMGIPKGYATSGEYQEILSYYGLDAEGITRRILED